MKLEQPANKSTNLISHECIYEYTYRQQKKGDKIYLKLRKKRKIGVKGLKKMIIGAKYPIES